MRLFIRFEGLAGTTALATVVVIAAALGQVPAAAAGSRLENVARSPSPNFAATKGWHLVEGAGSAAGQSIAITNWTVRLPDPHGFNHQIRPGRIAIFATSLRSGRPREGGRCRTVWNGHVYSPWPSVALRLPSRSTPSEDKGQRLYLITRRVGDSYDVEIRVIASEKQSASAVARATEPALRSLSFPARPPSSRC